METRIINTYWVFELYLHTLYTIFNLYEQAGPYNLEGVKYDKEEVQEPIITITNSSEVVPLEGVKGWMDDIKAMKHYILKIN